MVELVDLQEAADFIGLPASVFETHDLATFVKTEGNAEAVKACNDLLGETRPHFFLTLTAPCGRGKTHLAIATLIRFIRENGIYKAKYYQTESLLDDLRSKFDRLKYDEKDNFTGLLNQVKHIKLLVIDDMGAEKGTEWARAKLDEIIDDRYLNQRLTIVTTNLAVDSLPPRIASRLREGVTVIIRGEDYRLIKAKARIK
jgi:DNA replication protein DnaC